MSRSCTREAASASRSTEILGNGSLLRPPDPFASATQQNRSMAASAPAPEEQELAD